MTVVRNTYLVNYFANFFQILYVGSQYGGHKICEFDRKISPVVIEIQGVENVELVVSVNNTYAKTPSV